MTFFMAIDFWREIIIRPLMQVALANDDNQDIVYDVLFNQIL